MRLAVLADIHGNLPALEAVLADIPRHDVAGILVAGDYMGGPHPVETVRLLHKLGCTMVRGNGEDATLAYAAGQGPAGWRTSRQYAVLRWGYQRLDRATLELFAAMPEQCTVVLPRTDPIRLCHGSPRSISEHLFPDRDPAAQEPFRQAALLFPGREAPSLAEILGQITEPVLACGHTHIPWQQEQDGRLVFNPGAVCGPLNGDNRAQYALLTWQAGRWQVEHRTVPYDLARLRADFQRTGLLEEGGALARAFLLSTETGQNVAVFFLNYAYGLAAAAGHAGREFVPDDIWEQATATWDWGRFEPRQPHWVCCTS